MGSSWRKLGSGLPGALVVALMVGCGGGAPPEEPQPEPQPQPVIETRDEDEEARRREEEERRRREEERQRVISTLTERIHFDFDKSEIRSDAEQVLQQKVSVLREYPGVTLRIEGHADERGSNEYNLALGQRRAEAARRYLMSYGIEANRLSIISYGEERPLVNQSNEEAWAQNRRDEFAITDHGQLGATE